MSAYDDLKQSLADAPKRWLVTGAAGFIGSHLVEALLNLGQQVVGLDNFATGRKENLGQIRLAVGEKAWGRFEFVKGDICDSRTCKASLAPRGKKGVTMVLHQAALGSVPRSIEDPLAAHQTNTTGFLNVLNAATEVGARFVYASSSSVYGDSEALPKVEDAIGEPLSPYAATKLIDEIYAQVFGRCYGTQTIGLRYFNVFGPRQDPNGAYAAVIPKWIAEFMARKRIAIYGDGKTSRDFCFIENVVQANLLAATTSNPRAIGSALNIGAGEQTTLNELFGVLRRGIRPDAPDPIYKDFRQADVRHSRASIARARRLLGFEPGWKVEEGLKVTIDYYRAKMRRMTSSIGTS